MRRINPTRWEHTFTLLFAILIIALAANTASAERYTYRSGGEIVTLRGLR